MLSISSLVTGAPRKSKLSLGVIKYYRLKSMLVSVEILNLFLKANQRRASFPE
jgi:hypothetical protein